MCVVAGGGHVPGPHCMLHACFVSKWGCVAVGAARFLVHHVCSLRAFVSKRWYVSGVCVASCSPCLFSVLYCAVLAARNATKSNEGDAGESNEGGAGESNEGDAGESNDGDVEDDSS